VDTKSVAEFSVGVTSVVKWAKPSFGHARALEAVGARGVVLDNNDDLARAYPDLFKDTEAAKNARRRRAARTVSFPYNKVSIGKRHGPPTEVHYQLAGKGQKLKRAYYCPDQVADCLTSAPMEQTSGIA